MAQEQVAALESRVSSSCSENQSLNGRLDKANKTQPQHQIMFAQLTEQCIALPWLSDARTSEVSEPQQTLRSSRDGLSEVRRALSQTVAGQTKERNACEKMRILITDQHTQAHSEAAVQKMAVKALREKFQSSQKLANSDQQARDMLA